MNYKPVSQIVSIDENGEGFLTFVIDGKKYDVRSGQPNFNSARESWEKQNWEQLFINLTPISKIKNMFLEYGDIVLQGKTITHRKNVVNNVIAERIYDMMDANLDALPLVKFLDNLEKNPEERSRTEIYEFIKHVGLPITPNGTFLGYKKVRDDYKDWHTGLFDNSPGSFHRMKRKKVDNDANILCSNGFHVGSIKYADKEFHSSEGRIVIVEVNPRYAVSVPKDFDGQKIRVSRYWVISDYNGIMDGPVMQAPYNEKNYEEEDSE